MKRISIAAAGAMLLALTPSTQAQSLITGADTAAILSAARTQGKASLTLQENSDPLINGEMNGLRYQIYFSNCTDDAPCEDLNFYIGFSDLKPDLALINSWNRDKRFGRAYLDDVGDAVVEMDVDLVKGVTNDHLINQVAVWSQVMTEFTAYIDYR